MPDVRSILFAALAAFVADHANAAEPVDVALVLAADVSLSMSLDELALQRAGYVAALRHAEVAAAIGSGRYRRIALAVVEWAGASSQNVTLAWTIIDSPASAAEAARMLENAGALRLRRTSISGAINFASDLFAELPMKADRLVIDVSGDGPNNEGGGVTTARDKAVAAGITINGLPLMTRSGGPTGIDIANLDAYYRDCVIGGPGAFVYPVNDWSLFAEAVRRKLVLEIAGRPEQAIQAASEPQVDCSIGEKMWQNRVPFP